MDKNTVYILQKDLPFAKAGAEFIRENEDADYYNTNFANYHDRIHKSRVINNIEWFKPKEEPQWEILEFKSNDGNLLVLDGKKWKYRNDTNSISDIDFLIKNYAIHSVKRLSDGEVFSVGDYVEYIYAGASDNFYTPHLIKRFEIKDGVMDVQGEVPEMFNFTLISCKKSKAPKEEQVPIKVESIVFYTSMSEKPIRDVFSVRLTGDISEDKLQPIKKAIQSVINNDGLSEYFNKQPKLYSESELLQARRDAFDAAREVVGYSDALKNSPVTVGRKYKTREDYINSLNK